MWQTKREAAEATRLARDSPLLQTIAMRECSVHASDLKPPVIWRGAVRGALRAELVGAVDPIRCIGDDQSYLMTYAWNRRLASRAQWIEDHEYVAQRRDLRHLEIGVFCASSRPFCASSYLSSCPSSLARTLARSGARRRVQSCPWRL